MQIDRELSPARRGSAQVERKRKVKRKISKLMVAIATIAFASALAIPAMAWAAEGNVAKIGSTEYGSLASAISAAEPGDTVILIANAAEDVTVNKSLIIDGSEKSFTGNISVSGKSTAATVKNVNFTNGTGYAITTNRIKSITVENCKVENYGYGFLYANKSTPTIVVKNVAVKGGNYGMHWVYGDTATLEDVTMIDVANGLYIQNYAAKTVILKDCSIGSIAIWERSGSSGVQTFKFEGKNAVDTLSASQYAKYALNAEDATLEAPSGSTVTTLIEGRKVVYVGGTYATVKKDTVAVIGSTEYSDLAPAFEAAQAGDNVMILEDGRYTLSTSGKNITVTGAVDGVVFDNIDAKNMGGANVTFNNVTFDYYPNANYTGLQHSGNLVYKNCTFNGQVFLYGVSETFDNCTFNQESADAYNVWTYGAKKVSFINECRFNCAGKSILVYNEGGPATSLNVANCKFVASAPVEGKAAIEIDTTSPNAPGGMDGTSIVIADSSAGGFGTGSVSGKTLWNDKKDQTNLTVTVDDKRVWPLIKLNNGYVTADTEGDTYIYAEARNIFAKDSVYAELYSGDTKVATTTLTNEDYFTGCSTLGVNFEITRESSSWDTVWTSGGPWSIHQPDTMKLFIDGELIDMATVTMGSLDFPENWPEWKDVRGVKTFIPYIPPAPLPETGCGSDAACSVFSDVDADDWHHEVMDWAYAKTILRGYDDASGKVGPEDATMRTHVAVMMWRMAGEPAPTADPGFKDVKPGAWYYDAVAWAKEVGLLVGYQDGSNLFGTADVMTREQMAVTLFRFAQMLGVDVSVGEDTNILSYHDFDEISEYAIPAMQWAVGAGIVSGYTEDGEPTGFLGPKDDAERAHFAAMLMRMDEAYGIL